MTLGTRLKELRLAKGLSVRDAATLVGKSAGYISQIEVRGEIPTCELLLVISDKYGADFEELLKLAKKEQVRRAVQEIDAKHESALTLYRRKRRT